MALNHAIGPKTTRATEVQTMRSNSAPGHIYSVDVETVSSKTSLKGGLLLCDFKYIFDPNFI